MKPFNFSGDHEVGASVTRDANRALNAEPRQATERGLAAAGYLLYFAGDNNLHASSGAVAVLRGMLEAAIEQHDVEVTRAIAEALKGLGAQ